MDGQIVLGQGLDWKRKLPYLASPKFSMTGFLNLYNTKTWTNGQQWLLAIRVKSEWCRHDWTKSTEGCLGMGMGMGMGLVETGLIAQYLSKPIKLSVRMMAEIFS